MLDAVFWINGLLDVQSSDPLLAAYKYARRGIILCLIAQCALLVLAFSFAPDGVASFENAVGLVERVRSLVGTGFALIAVAFMLGMVWFTFRCAHIYFKPENYFE
jgi:hypothetical protein